MQTPSAMQDHSLVDIYVSMKLFSRKSTIPNYFTLASIGLTKIQK